VSSPAQRGARAALDAARPAVARLDASRGSEDLAADLIETWTAVEAALRALVNSSALSGQALIREARQRQMIDFDLANSLAELEAVHGRLQDTKYQPAEGDVNAARNAFLKLDAAMMGAGEIGTSAFDGPRPAPAAYSTTSRTSRTSSTSTAAPTATATSPSAINGEPVLIVSAPSAQKRRTLIVAGVAALILILVAAGGYALFGRRGSSSLQQGIDAYRNGQREVAVSAFTKASREDPKAPLPHIYIARMAREVGNFTLASQELQVALEADPNNAVGLREMGANLLAQGNNELARRFYVRAVQADPNDKSAQGYLGCALMRLNRVPEGTTFLNRAGPGPWSNCTPQAGSPAANPATTGAAIPRS
jgi:tetratricopeptide (TPR) repeat protein